MLQGGGPGGKNIVANNSSLDSEYEKTRKIRIHFQKFETALAWSRWPPKMLSGYHADKFLSAEGPAFVGSGCCGCRLLVFDAATVSRIQFAQHNVTSVHGVRVTLFLLPSCAWNRLPNVASVLKCFSLDNASGKQESELERCIVVPMELIPPSNFKSSTNDLPFWKMTLVCRGVWLQWEGSKTKKPTIMAWHTCLSSCTTDLSCHTFVEGIFSDFSKNMSNKSGLFFPISDCMTKKVAVWLLCRRGIILFFMFARGFHSYSTAICCTQRLVNARLPRSAFPVPACLVRCRRPDHIKWMANAQRADRAQTQTHPHTDGRWTTQDGSMAVLEPVTSLVGNIFHNIEGVETSI